MKICVFSVPMRNWNPAVGAVFWAKCPGFQRTYEELKRSGAFLDRGGYAVFSAYLWGVKPTTYIPRQAFSVCFQRTYEELKHDDNHINLTSFLGFQRTYEELKLRNTHGSPVRTKVFSVPMRNWNLVMLSSPLLFMGFSAYLWGIETQLFHIISPLWL